MSQQFVFDDKETFLKKLKELAESGMTEKHLRIHMPYPVHEVNEILKTKGSGLWKFTAAASVTGLVTGYAFTGYTVWEWPLLIAGKPLFSVPPYTIIAFELTILFGAVVSFLGYLILARQPSLKNILEPEDYGNRFVILVEEQK